MRSTAIRDLCAKAMEETPEPPAARIESEKTAGASDLVADIDAALADSGQPNNRNGKIALAKLLAAADILDTEVSSGERKDRS